MARTRASDFQEKQHHLLVTAAHVFATQGMDKASMSQIAAQAGVSKSLLYHYYPSKDVLIFEIIHGHLVELDAHLAAAEDDSLPAEAQLEALVRAVLQAYRGADDQHQVQLNAAQALTPDQQAQIAQLERAIVRRFSVLIAQINPDLQASTPPLLMPVTMSLFGMMNWVYMWFRDEGPISRDDYAKLATSLILKGVKTEI